MNGWMLLYALTCVHAGYLNSSRRREERGEGRRGRTRGGGRGHAVDEEEVETKEVAE